MAAATGETYTINYIADADTDGAFQWTTPTKRTIFEGWQIIGKVADLDDTDPLEEPLETAWTKIIALKAGQQLTWTQLHAKPFKSKAPARYTEATLVRELEKHGIGRPSTFASLIATIQDKSYAEIKTIPGKSELIKSYTINSDTVWPPTHTQMMKTIGGEKKKLVPTDLGRTALKFALQHFEDLFAYKFTAQMEKRLDKVADGEEPWKKVLKDVWASYKDRYDALMKTRTASGSTSASAKIRDFGDGLKAVISKKGPLILRENSTDKTVPPTFYGWPAGLAFQDITEEAVKAFVATAQTTLGTWRGHPIIKKKGKFGPYVQAGDTIASIEETDTVEQIGEKLTAKADKPATTPLKTFKEYAIYNGQYGPYIIKPALKQRKFVGVPKGVKIETLTEAEVDAIYKAYKPNKFASKKSNV
jgi:DNA topoisomerase-1